MYLIPPYLVPLLAALAGALLMGLYYRSRARSIALGAGLGIGAGLAGTLFFMLPLEFCTFQAERSALDMGLGIALMAAGLGVSLVALDALAQRIRSGKGLASDENQPGAFKDRRAGITAFVLLLPTLLILGVFLYYPMLDTFRLSTLLTRLGAPRSRFICLDNFTRLLNDSAYLHSLSVSFVLALAMVLLALSLSLLIATMAYQPLKGAAIYRTLLIWPYD
jgi:sn-glycerol 3-phosphate transport system permease protein